jgi:hypothetical protein
MHAAVAAATTQQKEAFGKLCLRQGEMPAVRDSRVNQLTREKEEEASFWHTHHGEMHRNYDEEMHGTTDDEVPYPRSPSLTPFPLSLSPSSSLFSSLSLLPLALFLSRCLSSSPFLTLELSPFL